MFGFPRPCPTHDVPFARRIAQLGIDPDAVTKLQADPAVSFTESHANPNLIDCGRERCRDRRR
ncbi:hypothetical protein [Streptomyces halstedii]|uniref:hypothetical protein n=1 Tax=Streptomyces halstedii TaxID=1944 RepID=UPI00381994A0